MRDHQELRTDLGAYVLGALEPDERRDFERHLDGCTSCRDEVARLSGLVPLLDRLEPDEAADVAQLLPPQTITRGAALRITVAAAQLRRQVLTWRLATAAAAAAAVLAIGLWAPWESGPDRWLLHPSAGAVDGTAAALAWEWGTTVELDLTGLPPADRYVVWAVAADGRREQAGTWGETASGRARVRGASAIQRDDLARIEITPADADRVLVAFEVAEPDR